MKKSLVFIIIGLVGLALIFFYQLLYFSDNKFHVVFCDVGQGDAIFIRTPSGVDILVDGGPDESVMSCLSSHMPFWDRKIELVFATHPDADHITGLISLAKHYQIGSYGTSINSNKTAVFRELAKTLKDRNIPVHPIRADDMYRISDGVKIQTFWPQQQYVDEHLSDDTNSYSLVQKVTYGSNSVLLNGDITFDILDQLMDEIGPVDVFKLAHHGSYTGTDEETFKSVKPKLAIISAGKNNRYGHPHQSVLKILKESGIPYLRTDEIGEIEFVSDGEKIQMFTDK